MRIILFDRIYSIRNYLNISTSSCLSLVTMYPKCFAFFYITYVSFKYTAGQYNMRIDLA